MPCSNSSAIPSSPSQLEWITAKLLRLGIHPYEVPVSYYPRKPEDGKKIRFRDGLLSIWTAYEWRFRSIKRIQKRVASLSDVDEKHVRHVKYAQGAFLLSMLAAVLPVEFLAAAIGAGLSRELMIIQQKTRFKLCTRDYITKCILLEILEFILWERVWFSSVQLLSLV